MNAPNYNSPERLSIFKLVILVLSILILVILVIDTTSPVPREVSRIMQGLDVCVCALFFIDFCIRFARSERKPAFMKWGWIDLLASIPFIDAFRIGRLVRIFQVLRLIRAVRSMQRLSTLLLENKLRSGFASVVLTFGLLVFFSSSAILLCEQTPEANIKTAGDAVWWSVTTVTTVGYGDKYPITTEGRILTMFLMVSGVGLFGTLSGLLASFFLGSRTKVDANHEALVNEIRSLRTAFDERNQPPTLVGNSSLEIPPAGT